MTEQQKKRYRHIFQATLIFGFASGLNILFQIVRVKVLAVLLGVQGMGLFGLMQSLLDTASKVAGMGIATSTARQIAGARAAGASLHISQIVLVACIYALSLGMIGAAIVFILREPIAEWLFGKAEHVSLTAWVGIGIIFTVVGQAISAVLQGFRRIGDQARLQILSGAFSTVLAIAAIAMFAEKGIVMLVLAAPAIIVCVGIYYIRNDLAAFSTLSSVNFFNISRQLFQIGAMVMAAGVLQNFAALTLRSEITKLMGIGATGLFQAAWSLSFVYVSFVLEAMGRDYLPHLTEVVSDKSHATKLIQEQLNVVLIMAGPGLVFMVVLAPLIIDLLYTNSFSQVAPLVQLMGVGNFLKICSWPLAFIVLAQGRSVLFFCLELIWVSIFYPISIYFLPDHGLQAVGVVFIVAYLVYFIILYFVCQRLTTFYFSRQNIYILIIFSIFVSVAFLLTIVWPERVYAIGSLMILGAATCSYYYFSRMFGASPLSVLRKKLRSKI